GELRLRSTKGGLQTLALGQSGRAFDVSKGNLALRATEDERLPDHATGSNREARQSQFLSASPNPAAITAASAFTASFSSRPSAQIWMLAPQGAARRRRPRIDFPSISLSLNTTVICDSNFDASATKRAAAR